MGEPLIQTDRSPGCGLWILWTLVSMVGMLVGWVAGWALSYILPGELASAVLGASVGISVGVGQWLVLRRWIHAASWWIPATAIGWTAGFYLGADVAQWFALAEIAFGAVIGGLVGFCTGVLQWLVLRTAHTRAGWWILGSVVSWMVALMIYRPGISAGGALYGLLVGSILGGFLVSTLRRQRSGVWAGGGAGSGVSGGTPT